MMLMDCPAPATVDASIDDATLLARLTSLAKAEREARADFIVYLAAFDQRRLYAPAGYSSLFAWLTDHLHIPNASAFRRMTAARLHARMPAVAAYLREGRLSLTKLCYLKDVLEPSNCLDLLEQAASMSEKEVEELAVVLDPRRVVAPPRDSIRPLMAPVSLPLPDLFVTRPPAPPPSPPTAPAPMPTPAPESTPRAIRHVIKMTVGPEFMGLLEEVRAELSHAHPGASLEVLLAESMKRALADWRKRSRGATTRPRNLSHAAIGSRTIPASVRRAVWERDAGRCTFVAEDGHRCAATHRLQFHHRLPFARGGTATLENLTILCAMHNDLMARADFGDQHMDRFTGTR
jgi:hypothetical protein